ncbi:YhgN family NAAT transporter [Thalassotalea aquiviva]|uniref:YhgN family NAAT transporter n=1 Tax=Thalassotalea aquiviva TaxID=3242415 RepID=UPI00352AACB9
MELLTIAVTLFLIMDPLGNLPVFVSILKDIDAKRQRQIMIRELLIALLIMFLFLFAGENILSFLHLKQESVSIAGGIILFIIAIKMIFPQPGGLMGLDEGEEPFLVPIAVPMMAGPSILASLILFTNQMPNQLFELSIALVIAWALSAIILIYSNVFNRLLGERGLKAMERLMGMILVMIAVQMLLDGLAKYASNFY